MKKLLIIMLVSLVFIVLLGSGALALTAVQNCTALSTNYETYELNNSIRDELLSATTVCLTVTANHTIINGNGSSIIGNGTGIGIQLSNVYNVTITGFANIQNFSEYEVYLKTLSGENNGWISIYNNTFNGSSTNFVYIKNSSNVNVTDNTFIKRGFVLSDAFDDGPLVYIIGNSRNITVKNNFFNSTINNSYAIDAEDLKLAGSIDISNNFITTNANKSYGMELAGTAGVTTFNVTNNTIEIFNTSSYGVASGGGLSYFVFDQNNITMGTKTSQQGFTDGTGDTAYTFTNNLILNHGNAYTVNFQKVTLANFSNNIFNVTSSGTHPSTDPRVGLFMLSAAHNTFVNNTFAANGTYGYAALITGSNTKNNTFTNDSFLSSGTGSLGFRISATGGSPSINIFKNILVDGTSFGFSDISTTSNTLVFENSVASINWTNTNLTSAIRFRLGIDIFLENNLVGIVSNISTGALNYSAAVQLKNLTYNSTLYLLKDGVRCDDTDVCNVSYNAATGLLMANVSSFSNYTTQGDDMEITLSSLSLSDNVSTTFLVNVSVVRTTSNQSITNVTYLIRNSTGENVTVPSFLVNASSSSSWSNTSNVSALTDGAYTLEINSTDGNFSNIFNISLTIDKVAPTVVTVSPGNNTNYTSSSPFKDFNFTINDSTTLVESVVLQFSNGTKAFNMTASNSTDVNWNVSFFNFTRLAEGNHTVTIFANDSAGNVNTSSYLIRYDATNPSVTVSCTSNPAAGTIVTCTCTASDAGSSIKSVGFEGGSASVTEATTVSGSGTSTSCKATDHSGNTASTTGSWTVATASSSSSSGGGGSSAGQSTTLSGVSEKKIWDSVYSGDTGTIEIENGAIGVTEVSFKVNKNIYGAWVKVTKKESFPLSVKDFGTGVYRKLEVSKSSTVKDETLDDIVIKFKVEKDWLTKESLSKSNVALYRFVDGKWTTLETSLGADDGTYIHYTAESPGFSYFVIGGKTTISTPVVKKDAVTSAATSSEDAGIDEAGVEAGTEAVPGASAEQTMAEKSGSNVWWIVLVLVILILGAGLLWWLSKKK